jgi:hypothetical protein
MGAGRFVHRRLLLRRAGLWDRHHRARRGRFRHALPRRQRRRPGAVSRHPDPEQPPRRDGANGQSLRRNRSITFSGAPVMGNLCLRPRPNASPIRYTSRRKHADFSTGTRFVRRRLFLSALPKTSGSCVPSPLRDALFWQGALSPRDEATHDPPAVRSGRCSLPRRQCPPNKKPVAGPKAHASDPPPTGPLVSTRLTPSGHRRPNHRPP